jgi:predicted nucleic acid-binding protein
MLYVDTDFVVALLKRTDWLKERARRLLQKHRGELWTSGYTIVELFLIAEEFGLDPQQLVIDVFELVEVRNAELNMFLIAAGYIKEGAGVFDSLHAAFCGKDKIISSDKVFDRLGLERVKLEAA